ncbi:hypothetical protein RA280_40220 [Cupriavidus sp. CV2]|uniref:hypothetical protein n=1 Tax=Cupriavidus ulmosensis TaxID=3065913 RepID=UPI00296B35E0|nr:hypothetical protein [Cupriavidus sp. CV2]MDW3687850.1 hypothetical protein [Cupriavidus sp. CV2]
MENAERFGYNKPRLQSAFDELNERNSILFDRLSTQEGIRRYFTELGVWEPLK